MAAEFGEQYGGMQGQMRRSDGHGHGNPITEGMQHGGPHTAVEGMQHGGPHGGTTPTAIDEGMHQHQQQQPQLRRSGSSSSSSSEDDGEGGRRKKGTKGKMMKEKLGDSGQEGDQHHPTYSAEGGEEAGAGGHKKGMMEKIKDKIPGMH